MAVKKVMMMGDTHADFGHMNRIINKHKPDVVIVCGDFGYWPPTTRLHPIKNGGCEIYFCDGNHENHMFLKAYREAEGNELKPIMIGDWEDVYYMPRGSVLELNGKRILFMGGAESIDKAYRIKGYDWFEEESITREDIAKIPDGGRGIDVVVSHTAPDFIIRYIGGDGLGQSEKQLRRVYGMVKPKDWYFGHMHRKCDKKTGDVHFHGLNMVPNSGCWQWLEETNGD